MLTVTETSKDFVTAFCISLMTKPLPTQKAKWQPELTPDFSISFTGLPPPL